MSAANQVTTSFKADARQRARALAFTALMILGLCFLRLFNPVGSGLYPPCLFHQMTGLYCPGCGSTRALYNLVHGNAAAAFAMNPMFVILLPLMIYGALSYALLGLRGRGLPRTLLHPGFFKLLFWTAIAFGILRNLPFYPFNLLAPHTL